MKKNEWYWKNWIINELKIYNWKIKIIVIWDNKLKNKDYMK